MDYSLLAHIFNTTLSGLLETISEQDQLSAEVLYAEFLCAYLKSDIKKMRMIHKKFDSHFQDSESQVLSKICEIRELIKTQKRNDQLVADHEKVIENYEFYKGEFFLVKAFYFFTNKNFVKAKIAYRKAYKYLGEIGCERKSLLALQNHIAAIGNMEDPGNLIPEYIELARKAKRSGFEDILSLALQNLSREYQKRGAHLVALKYIEEAIECESELQGSLQYWLNFSQKADILLDLERKIEALSLIEMLKGSDIDEIQNTLVILQAKADKLDCPQSLNLSATWNSRTYFDEKTLSNLGPLEQELIKFISKGPKEKNDIIYHLYGDKVDYHSLENRFKRLLFRTRKKLPDLIIYKDGVYQIADGAIIKGEESA